MTSREREITTDTSIHVNMKKREVILSIAGSDSSAGAGIQADLKSSAALGVYCATAITAVTAQNTRGVDAVYTLSGEQVEKQILSVMDDLNVVAIKIGMVPSLEIVEVINRTIFQEGVRSIILDPVMISTSGHRLVSDQTIDAIIDLLLPKVTLITPNIPECEFLSGVSITGEDKFKDASNKIKDLGVKSLLLKAGHLNSNSLTDYLYNFQEDRVSKYSYDKIDTLNTHGTGCSLSSAIAAASTITESLKDAVAMAEEFLHRAIIEGRDIRWGDGHGPIKHL